MQFLVIWRADADVIQSNVTSETSDLSPRQWIELAAISEGDDPDAITNFDLYAVIIGPVQFAY